MDPQANVWRWNPALRVESHQRDGRQVLVVHDPAADAYYELGPEEHAIARAFATGRDFETVLEERASPDQPMDRSDLAEFVASLAEARILLPAGEPPAADALPHAPPRPTRLGGRLLEIRIATLDAGRFFAASVRWVRPFLGAPLGVAAAAALVAAVAVTGANWGELVASVGATLAGVNMAAVWLLYGVVVVLHEMAHGVVCAAFGGRVKTLGFLVLYGKPCAYCDVSDAWLLGRGPRLWIMAAGGLVEVGLWAAATLAWRVTSPETWAHQGAVVLLTICGVATLFNFNPLLRLDGYYMLSDGLEIPNLRQRAFADLGRRLLGRRREPATARERRVFLWYGVLALVYSAALVGYLLARLHTWMGARWGGPGLVFLWGVLGALAIRPLGQGLAEVAAAWRAAPRLRRLCGWGAVGLLAAVLAFVRWPLKVSSECRIEPRARVVVRSLLGGSVESVAVREGDVVQAGQVLVQLATRDLDFALATAEAEVRELEAKLALLESGPRQQEIDMARRRVDEAVTRVDFARRAHDRARTSLQGDLVSRAAAEAAERELQLAEEGEHGAREALDLLEAGTRPEELQAMRARLEAVRTQAARLQDELRRTRIPAPLAGQVLSAHAERLVGRYVARGDSLLDLADLGTMVVEIPVPEKEVGDVTVGAAVRFKARSLPSHTFAGRVVAIAPAAERGARQRTVLVRSEIDNGSGLLRPGTTGFAKIYCGRRPLGAVLAHRGVRVLRTEFWALW